ncbi:MAG: TetR/AcrR family transcriptional regulator [Anaerolineaceae bacterium]
MRRARDGIITRESVIASAKEVFAEHGFSGTSLKMISERCGVSVGLILHHFKSKRNLYDLILADLARGYFITISQAGKGSSDPEKASQDVLRSSFNFWSEDTTYNRMSLWAYLENQTQLIDEEVKLTTGLASAVQHMQAEGKVDPSFSPFVLLTMTIGPIHFWVRYREIFKQALHLDETLEDLNKIFLEQYIRLIQKMYQTIRED